MFRRKSGFIILAVATVTLFGPLAARADFQAFNSQPNWLAAVGGSSQATVFHFDGPTETTGKAANDPTIIPSYTSQGVDFLPFTGTSILPEILRGQGFQITDPNRDGLLGNTTSPNPVEDLDGRAIKFNFNIPAKSVGVFTNIGDGGFLEAYDVSMALIGTVNIDSGGFGGIVTDRLISHVAIVNTFNSDITFGIWDLQFSQNGLGAAAPEPGTLALVGMGLLGLLARRRK